MATRNSILLVLIALVIGFQASLVLDHPQLFDSQRQPDIVQNQTVVQHQFQVNDSRDQLYNSIFENVRDSTVSITVLSNGEPATTGSGFVYDRQGHIVTNEHVVDTGDTYEVQFLDGETYRAELVGADAYTDLAVLRIQADRDVAPIPLGSEESIKTGYSAIAIGNPFGRAGSMTEGIISQTDRLLPVEGQFSLPNVIQTDAAINPGNSGGPLLNRNGEVIGINTAIDTRDRTFSGIGFAVPVTALKRVVPELIEDGDYQHPWIGVAGVDMSLPIAEEMDVNRTSGFLVDQVHEDSPAARAGLQGGDREVTIRGNEMRVGGDIIVAIDGHEVRQIHDILNYLARETEVGDTITLTVIRDGEKRDVELTLDARP